MEGRTPTKRPRESCKSNLTNEGFRNLKLSLFFELVLPAFDFHVSELAGFKYLATVLAFDVLGLLIARNDANS